MDLKITPNFANYNQRAVSFGSDAPAVPKNQPEPETEPLKPVYFKDFLPYINTNNSSEIKQFNAASVQKEAKELYESQNKIYTELVNLYKSGAKVSPDGNKIITEVTNLPGSDTYVKMQEITKDGKIAKEARFLSGKLLGFDINVVNDGLAVTSDISSSFANGELIRCSKGNASYDILNESKEMFSYVDSKLFSYSKDYINFPEVDEAKLRASFRDDQIYSVKENYREAFPFEKKENIEYISNIKKQMQSYSKPSAEIFSPRFIEMVNEFLPQK